MKSIIISLWFLGFFLLAARTDFVHEKWPSLTKMDKKIIVIGAGASGVAAATKLISNGFRNVMILEAENRLGGRVNTIPFGKNVLDMGGQWCVGEKNNVVYQMAKDTNLLAHGEGDNVNYIRSNGELIPSEISTKLEKLAFNIFSGDNFKDDRKNYHGSLGNFFAEKYKDAIKTGEFKTVNPEWIHEFYDSFEQNANHLEGGISWYETPSNSSEEACEGDPSLNWKDNGYVTVFDLLQNKLPGSSKPVIDVIPLIGFNKTVSKIKYNQPNGVIEVEVEDGSSYSADHVICTVSLGVLKERHWQLFEPLLAQDRIDSIDGMKLGTIDKIYLEFEKPFWNESWQGSRLMWRKEEIKTMREDPVNGDWITDLGYVTPASKLQPNIICCWIVAHAAHIMEQKSDADVKAGAEKFLRLFFKQHDIPDAKAMIRSKWYSNPHFRGSTSTYTLKGEALDASPYKLAEPITDKNGKPIVQFAGEATSGNHYASVHGAIETGWREADRLIELYK